MRGLGSACILLLIVIPTVLPGLSSQPWENSAVHGGEPGGLLLVEVCPGKPVEYVIVRNLGADIDLNGTTISDGEGSLTFGTLHILPSFVEVAIAADASVFALVHPDVQVLELNSPDLRKSGRFALADDGDDVRLLDRGGDLIDLLVYGKSAYSGAGWTGAPAAKGGSADALVRGSGDTNSSSDWSPAPPGRSAFAPSEFNALVEPFTAPENAAERLVRELRAASSWVKAAVYELTDPVVVNAFIDCVGRGVNVSVLIEGQPVGGLSEASRAAATALSEAGCDVRLLRSQDAYKRYDYLHAKYLVADGLRSVVMSENWGTGLWNNRGWGVAVDSSGLASYLEGVFDADFGGKMDVSTNVAPAAYEGGDVGSINVSSELLRWRAYVVPVVSPDFSADSLSAMIASARERVLVQQLYCQEEWLGSEGLLSDLFEAASRGVEVRILLDNTFSAGDENEDVVKAANALAARMGVDLQAKVITSYHGLSIMHNKGVIADDQALVSSINWGDTALRENREMGLLVRSPEIADFFSRYFWQDWADDPLPPTVRVAENILAYAGDPVLLDGGNITDRTGISLITWDLDGDGVADGTGERFIAVFGEGTHVVTVTAYDRFNNSARGTITVTALPAPGERDEGAGTFPWLAIVPLVPVASLIVWKRLKKREGH